LLDTAGSRHPARHDGLRPARMQHVSPPRGADGRAPEARFARDERGTTLTRQDRHRPRIAGTVRQHGDQPLRARAHPAIARHRSPAADNTKTPGAPTPSVLQISFEWCAPEIDQTVAKR
jgi:hypothetical protein